MRFEKFPTLVQWQTSCSMIGKVSNNQMFGKVQPTVGRGHALVAAIDDLVKRFHMVMDMSKLNILMELRERMYEWASNKTDCDVNPKRLDATQALLDVTLRTMVELNGSNKHRYVKAACIGYDVKTGRYTIKKPTDEATRMAHEEADAMASCGELVGVIRAAWKAYTTHPSNNVVKDDSKTLKIFMVPEFFFRGRYGAYMDVGLCSKIMARMRKEIVKPEYTDWLFVHGT